MLPPNTQTSLALVAVLLLLWLLLRVREPEVHRARRTPLTPAELARMTFDAVRADDVRAWRELFLVGGNATQALGGAAEAWLEACTPAALGPDFAKLRRDLPAGARFLGGRADAENRAFLLVQTGSDPQHELLVGRFVRVGSALRLLEPASGPFHIAAE